MFLVLQGTPYKRVMTDVETVAVLGHYNSGEGSRCGVSKRLCERAPL